MTIRELLDLQTDIPAWLVDPALVDSGFTLLSLTDLPTPYVNRQDNPLPALVDVSDWNDGS